MSKFAKNGYFWGQKFGFAGITERGDLKGRQTIHGWKFDLSVGVVEWVSLCGRCPYLKFFWSVFSRIQAEYGEMRNISPYSVQMRENTNQKNSEYGHFSCSVFFFFKMVSMEMESLAVWTKRKHFAFYYPQNKIGCWFNTFSKS